MKGNVTVRVGESTNSLHLSASFGNSALSRIGNFPALIISDVSWIVPRGYYGSRKVTVGATWNCFSHTENRLNDVFTSSLQINNFNLQTDRSFTIKTKDHEINYSIESAVKIKESDDRSEP